MSRWVFSLAVLLGGAVVSRPAEGADAAGAPSTADADKQARSLFAQGQIHYSLGEYEQAIVQFRRAYELTSASGLLFNIAQAHRLNGQCREALEIYRHFVRLAPDSPYRAEAETQIAALSAHCATAVVTPLPPSPRPPASAQVDGEPPKPAAAASAPAAPALISSPQADLATQPPPRWSTRRRTSAVLLAGGIGAGLAAGAVYWWNSGRYDDWQKEDHRLAAGPLPGMSNSAWLADQQQNDARLRSIQRVDTIDLVLLGLSVTAIVASAVTLVLLDH